jgi:hypothetical protein
MVDEPHGSRNYGAGRATLFAVGNQSPGSDDYHLTRFMSQDGAIVERVLAGDRDAFGILIDRHRDGATRLAMRMLRSRADAEDVAQEALLHAFLDLAELRDRARGRAGRPPRKRRTP